MGDIRFERKVRGGFTVLLNGILRDPRLSLRTKGLFAVMCSLPEDWEYSVAGLASVNGVGKDAIRVSLREMEQAGYLTREAQSHGARGKFAASVYVIHEESASPLSDLPTTVEPTTAGPTSAQPSSGNPTQLNKDIPSKDFSKTPYSPPSGDKPVGKKKSRGPKSAPDWKPERFERFWEFYPRGEDRVGAVREWDKLRPDDGLIDRMACALARQKATEAWTAGIGIPYACRWLRNRRWEDVGVKAAESGQPSVEGAPHLGWD